MTDRIDYIVPLVNPDDPKWREDFARTCKREGINASTSSARWRNWGTDCYIFRALEQNLPWLGTVHVLVSRDSQVPAWLNTAEAHVVTHADIMPARHLPTFNSQAFEMYLGNIPGLSERFIYSNDDMFPLAPLTPGDFFRDGVPCLHHNERTWSALDSGLFRRTCREELQLIAPDFGRTFTNTWLKDSHGLSPMLLSTLRAVWDRHGEQLDASPSPFRRPGNFNQYIFNYWQHLSGQYIDHTPRTIYTDNNMLTPRLCELIKKAQAVLVVNDCGSGEEWAYQRAAVLQAFEERLPKKSKYEL